VDTDGHPRIVKLWGGYDPRVGIDFYAQYDMLISQSFHDAQLLYLRDKNPSMIILQNGVGTYDADDGPLGSQWVDAPEGSDEFECFYRGTNNQVLKVSFWGHGMFNMGDDWCTDAIADYVASQYKPGIHRGVFFDRITQVITPVILDGIDLDHDGSVDDRDVINDKYWRGTEAFLDKVRQRLGDELVIVANHAPLFYTSRLNGREYETFMTSILDEGMSWTRFRYNYEQWMQSARSPELTMVMANPPFWLLEKYGLRPYVKMKDAMVNETAAYYQRMRFGLTTTLLEGGYYSFEFGETWHGNAWWYDEFDAAGMGKGYLGSPLGEAYYASGPLSTPNMVQNPGFEESELTPWHLRIQGAQASLTRVPVTATHPTTMAARIVITTGNQPDAVHLEQAGIPLVDDRTYTLSFWGKATRQLWDTEIRLHETGNPGNLYGLKETLKLGTTWQQYWVPFAATATTNDANLAFDVGLFSGTVWIDEVNLQQDTLPTVFRRDFENGIVLCNATTRQQTIPLNGDYRKIVGTQAPLVKMIVDDTEESTGTFIKNGGWAGHTAGYDEWGDTYHHALTTIDPNAPKSSVTWRTRIPLADQYTVYAWLAPHTNCNDTVTYTIQYAGGTASVAINPDVSEPTWANLGTFPFAVGMSNAITLTNLTHSTWVVADAIKYESVTRYNNGAQVTSVTLEGQDGIILLNGPPMTLPIKLYLPLIKKRGP
jgi:hypothetical protein